MTRRRLSWLVGSLVVALILAAGTGAVVVRRLGLPWLSRTHCTATSNGHTVNLSLEQAQRAGTIAAGVVDSGRPARAATEAIGTELSMPRRDAGIVASALTGNSPDGFNCVLRGGVSGASDRLNADGLVPRADRVLADLRRVFGAHLPVGGFAPGGVETGHMPGSAHYEGRAVDIFVRPISPANTVRGRAIAAYLLSQADRLDIATLIFDNRIWTRARSAAGWRDYHVPAGTHGDLAILQHRDHVHVDVFR